MSRIGKQPINIPAGVEVKIDGGLISVKGPKGELSEKLHPLVNVEKKEGQLLVAVSNPEDKKQRSLWGLFQRLISNLVIGVTKGFSKQLEVNGIGYKAAVSGGNLVLHLGYSHPVEFKIPKDLEIKVEKNIITIAGAGKQLVGQAAAQIRALRKPEPYKGKGIKYAGEVIRRKAGKTAAKAA
ncbi:MAG: 50S ribosomal protein L6 [Candidatus Buchananbacteria bacterium RIFCSPHIGHO2_02_FULL_45_11b]|uniref:Large ribosomal subunit protein uL6 n=4 Tax=Candidatus Buchananiibacteriota TaxID=1817903 RepID=A0A1G1Y5W8_9BACT|nr:MAG: 50S ribosomal protein L6 [Candidatus Buchananbacteria bacterium RIFCSPHIGHO2_01_FULL_46_12]OGY50489.1 MAG: 50S ribosomal protein L6 [Candidatus Buchananbacteria bacterium RIFCSPHIGHO2_02_FULL_45_11b]OGY53461.1 MAG: 50S ribosomal protein L6 [Candidatus Buchananbacteria bacterium RIFCSPLOWO2_01_FULL_45_31]OGY57066.1 MAG: 50S ribosomal protein L6 [Candidatus Buchananbacteria bacterium RIFCSPLOWO2_02_FULL_46_11b]